MNTQSIAFALAFAAAGFASASQAADIVTLQTVQVRPSADQLAQAELERNSSIPTLAAVQVRPTVGQIVELAAERTAARLVESSPMAIGANVGEWMVSLPAITVRPDARLLQELAAELAADGIGQASARVSVE